MKAPPYELVSLTGRDGEPFTFTGRLLGAGSSRRDDHMHDLLRDRYAPRRIRCSACRWFEVAIYVRAVDTAIDLETDPPTLSRVPAEDGDYVVHTVGATVVPGEQRLSRISVTESPFEVIELLTVRRHGQDPFLTAQSSRALAQAAELDDGIREAYINRAVV